jgi:hypothetical protein
MPITVNFLATYGLQEIPFVPSIYSKKEPRNNKNKRCKLKEGEKSNSSRKPRARRGKKPHAKSLSIILSNPTIAALKFRLKLTARHLAIFCLLWCFSSDGLTPPSVALSLQTNGLYLILQSFQTPGTIAIQQAPSLPALANNPVTFLLTNTPLPVAIEVPIPAISSSQAYFRAVFLPKTNVVVSVTAISTNGGLILAPPNSPLAGVTLNIPANSYQQDCTFTLGYASPPSGQALIGTPAMPLITVDNGGLVADSLVSITIPMNLAPNEVALACLLDPSSGTIDYAPLTVSTNGTVTVFTTHFCDLLRSQ